MTHILTILLLTAVAITFGGGMALGAFVLVGLGQ